MKKRKKRDISRPDEAADQTGQQRSRELGTDSAAIIRAHRDGVCIECAQQEHIPAQSRGKTEPDSAAIIRAHRDGICIECGRDIVEIDEGKT